MRIIPSSSSSAKGLTQTGIQKGYTEEALRDSFQSAILIVN
jgi:hypothetical protein